MLWTIDEHDAVNSFFPDRAVKRFDILDFVQRKKDGDLEHHAGCEAAC